MSILIPHILSGSQGLTVRQAFPTGAAIPGKRSAWVKSRTVPELAPFFDIDPEHVALTPGGIVVFEQETDDTTGGLFELNLHTPLQRRAVILSAINLRLGPAVAWTVTLTDGRGTASSPEDVDDPTYDTDLETGTGNKHLNLAIELPARACVRVKTSNNTSLNPGIIELIFLLVTDTHARPMI